MYVAVDIGGTKTLVAVFDKTGHIISKTKIPTSHDYKSFMSSLTGVLDDIWSKNIKAIGIAAPGRIDRKTNVVTGLGNLPWKNVAIAGELAERFKVDAYIDNDANLAGLAEANTDSAKSFDKVLYITVSTGIGTGYIVGGQIEPVLADSEGGHIVIERDGKLFDWEDLASGKAIKNTYGKFAYEIEDKKTWKKIAYNLSIGFQPLIAILQPDLIIVGGSIGTHFDKYSKELLSELEAMHKTYSDGLFSIPKITQAQHPQEAVVYGCYLLAKANATK